MALVVAIVVLVFAVVVFVVVAKVMEGFVDIVVVGFGVVDVVVDIVVVDEFVRAVVNFIKIRVNQKNGKQSFSVIYFVSILTLKTTSKFLICWM